MDYIVAIGVLGLLFGGLYDAFAPGSQIEVERRRAAGGLGMIVVAVAVFWHGVAKFGYHYFLWSWGSSKAVIEALSQGDFAGPRWIVWQFAIAAAVVVAFSIAGTFRLIVGWHRSRGPRDMVTAAMALFWVLAAATLLIGSLYGKHWAFLHYDWSIIPLVNEWLPVVYLWGLVKAATRLFLCVRGIGSTRTEKRVVRQKAHGDADFPSPDELQEQMSGRRRTG